MARTMRVSGMAALKWSTGAILAMCALFASGALHAQSAGPGGPVLVVRSSANPFGGYLAEILRTEGLNFFSVIDLQDLTRAVLDRHRIVILGETGLTVGQISMLTEWVEAGGRLLAMRPDKRLAALFGLTDAAATLSDRYLRIDTATDPGAGLVGETIQYHGTADLYTQSGATVVAALYADATLSTPHPAVTLHAVGAGGGLAAAFTYDLARSVVYTRQGNPAWQGVERDGIPPVRSDDQFYGAKAGDPQPDWIDLNKVAIPQADEQQRLLGKLVQSMNDFPLPRFWYFPKREKAVVIMTGDEHGCCANTRARFQTYLNQSPAGCSVEDWECVRASSYIYATSEMSDAEALAWTDSGFELGTHLNTGCADWTPSALESMYSSQLGGFSGQFPSLPGQVSHRTHCGAWSDWASQPEIEAAHGIRLDTTYYFWPAAWVNNRPGMFTGSGMPMRFAKLDGTLIDCYQAATQMTDESGQDYPFTIDTLLSRALGPEGYYGAFTANMHTDRAPHEGSDAIVASARSRGVPVVSGRQMLEWLDGRNGSSFGAIAWNGTALSFTITAAAGARNLTAMVPTFYGALTGITRDASAISYDTETVKGVEYAAFQASSGSYEVTYLTADGPPTITGRSPDPGESGVDVEANVTVSFSEALDPSTINGTTFVLRPAAGGSDVPASVTYAAAIATLDPGEALVVGTTYRVTVSGAVQDLNNDSLGSDDTWTFTTSTTGRSTDMTAADFGSGATGGCSVVAHTGDGEVTLEPTIGEEFSTLPSGWAIHDWQGGGSATISDGSIVVDGARFNPDPAAYGPGRSLEFVATYTAVPFQHVGFGAGNHAPPGDVFSTPPAANFSTGGPSVGPLLARAWDAAGFHDQAMVGSWFGTSHRYRLDWGASSVEFSIDGELKHAFSGALAGPMRPAISDFHAGGGAVTVDWIRMSDYASPCALESRIFDVGQVANWLGLVATGSLPAGTSYSFETRSGGSSSPDFTWSSFEPVAGGTIVSPNGRYLQYRALLSTSDVRSTPELASVEVTYDVGQDALPPTITGRSPSPSESDVPVDTNVTVQFSEPMAGGSIHGGTLRLRATGAAVDVPAVVTYAGLTATLDALVSLSPGTAYHVTVSGSVADQGGNTLGADDTWFFTTDSTETLVDTTAADFDAGTPDGCSVVAHTGDGELTLSPALGEEFSGPGLPDGWASTSWSGGGSASVVGGALVIDGARAGPLAAFGPGRSLEFVATFTPDHFQHAGMVTDFDFNSPWAIFSTFQGNGFHARTSSGANVPIPGDWFGQAHAYRIDWNAGEFAFFVDGEQKHVESFAVSTSVRPLLSDFDPGGGTLAVDWLRLSPYVSPCSFESRIFDAGRVVDWTTLVATGVLRAGAAYTFETRSGDSQAPDGTWSDYVGVGADAIGSPDARYLQYRAVLATSYSQYTPELQQVEITCELCSPEVCDGVDNDCDGVVDECYDGNACTTDGCVDGACTPTPITCDDNRPCTEDFCDPATGCVYTPDDTNTCTDWNACTTDACVEGVCTGTPITCDDNEPCTEDSCDPATGCFYTPDNTNTCADGNACTTDACDDGTCVGTPIACDDHDLCTADSCNPATGCVRAPITCNDNNACTTDSCNPVTGGCVYTSITCNDNDTCTTDSCNPVAGCVYAPITCNDAKKCTTDSCNPATGCVFTPVVCSAQSSCDYAGTCNPSTGICSNPKKPNGATCNDGNACSRTDTCQGGVCRGANPVTCTSGACYHAGTCDPGTGVCSRPPKADGTTCNDGNACTRTDACQAGTCTGANPVACPLPDACRGPWTCNPGTGTCSSPSKPNGTACSDDNACTRTDTCQNGTCAGASPVVCTASDACHDPGTCNTTTGACSNPAKPDGAGCNDANPCTRNETCRSGVCTGGTAPTCPLGTVEADATVKQASPYSNYGGALDLEARGGSAQSAILLRLRVTGNVGQRITRALLRLTVKNASSPSGGGIHATNCSWSESSVRWSTRPGIGPTLYSVGAVTQGQVAELDLTSQIQGDGTFCFMIDNPNGNVLYQSREAPTGKPQLWLETDCSTCTR